jgi:peptidoglycan/xylan/chitin deacetylase (PgdA/CDA1 family)
MTETQTFVRLLSRRQPFVSLEAALQDQGDALTIDDATHAAYDAALLARSCGHEVTLFINSDNVQNSAPYYLHVLSAVLEHACPAQLGVLCRDRIGSKVPADKTKLRAYFKHRLTRLPDETARGAVLTSLSNEMEIGDISLPKHLHTLSLKQLEYLVAAGVRLENHGGSHAHFSIFDDSLLRNEIERCKSWLSTKLSVDSRFFAVPFGDVLPRIDLGDDIARCWFMLTASLQAGFVGPKIFNRAELRFD